MRVKIRYRKLTATGTKCHLPYVYVGCDSLTVFRLFSNVQNRVHVCYCVAI